MFWRRSSIYLLAILAIAIPIEHKYDKLFRFFSLKLIPPNVVLPSFFEKKIYFYPSDIIVLTLFSIALFALRIPLRHFFLERGAKFLWLMFFFTLLSIAFSPLANYPILYIQLLQLLTPILLFSFLGSALTSLEKTKLTTLLLGCIFMTATIQSCFAIFQYAIQGPLHLQLLSEPHQFPSFGIENGHKWIFDWNRNRESISVIRSSGTFPHANVLGGFLSISILAGYSFFSHPRWRLFFAFLIPVQFFAMSLTFSRSALFSWALGTLIWFALHLKNLKAKLLLNDPAIRTLSITLFVSLLFSFVILWEPIVQRGGIVNYNGQSRGSDALRIRYQNVALQIIQDHPLSGVGFHQLSIRSRDYTSNDSTYPLEGGVHNIYLYLAAETGLISLAAFLSFIVSLLWAAMKTPWNPTLASLLAIFIAYLFIGACDFYPLLFQQGKLPFFLGAGLLAANAHFKKNPVLDSSLKAT